MDKAEIRKKIMEKRNSLRKEDLNQYSRSIGERLLTSQLYGDAEKIFSFISFGSEVQTHNLIKTMLDQGKLVGVPYTKAKNREMLASRIEDFDRDLEKSYFNILAPRPDELRPLDPQEIDLILVPGLAFDRNGYRVGYGGGYYDTFFEKVGHQAIKVGLCFDLQIIDSCPRGIYDLPVDYIITEREIIEIK